MSLERIAVPGRNRLRLHATLLLLWSVLVGIASSAVLLHLFQVYSMAVRYAVGAAAMHFLGFLGGGWCYAAWWNQSRERAGLLATHASQEEQVSYQELRALLRKPLVNPLPNGLKWFLEIFDYVLLERVGLVLFLAYALIVTLIYLFLIYLPVIGVETFAGYLAEVVLEFVIGASIVRKILKPRALDEYWPVMVKKTWITGCLLVAAAGATGFLIQHLHPGAETIFQALAQSVAN